MLKDVTNQVKALKGSSVILKSLSPKSKKFENCYTTVWKHFLLVHVTLLIPTN